MLYVDADCITLCPRQRRYVLVIDNLSFYVSQQTVAECYTGNLSVEQNVTAETAWLTHWHTLTAAGSLLVWKMAADLVNVQHNEIEVEMICWTCTCDSLEFFSFISQILQLSTQNVIVYWQVKNVRTSLHCQSVCTKAKRWITELLIQDKRCFFPRLCNYF
jgi:hypothetical protein